MDVQNEEDENEFNNLKEVYTALGIMDPIHRHMHKRQRNGVQYMSCYLLLYLYR